MFYLNRQIDREVQGLTVHCDNEEDGCTWRGKLRGVLTHRRTCPYEMVQCEYFCIGCEKQMYRKNLKDYNTEKAEEHLALSVTKLKSLEHITHHVMMGGIGIVRSWSMQLDTLSTMTAGSGDLVCPVIMKLPEFTTKKRNNEEWHSNSFYSHKKGYKMCLNACAAGDGVGKGTHLSVFLFIMKGTHDDELTWPLSGKFQVKLLNQISDCEHHLATVPFDDDDAAAGRVTNGDRADGGLGDQEFISDEDLHKVTSTCQYLKDDCVFLQINKL